MGSLVTKTEKEQKNSYSCDKCKDTTWILDNTGRVIERCKCYELIRVKEQWEASGLKTDDLDKTFKSYEPWNELTVNDNITMNRKWKIKMYKNDH